MLKSSKMKQITKKGERGKNKELGITLISLVITIIVLIILAGVTTLTLTGDNGILIQAVKAKEETRGANVEEFKDFWKINKEMDKHGIGDTAQEIDELLSDLLQQNLITKEEKKQIEETGKVKIGSKVIVFSQPKLPYTEETVPYYPDEDCTYVEGDLDSGLVIADGKGNEYVWIEVPKSVTQNANTKDELYDVLNQYSIDYKDTWGWGLTNSDFWYEGCGLTENEYNENYVKMLNSIKENGGFYIGRYEMGSTEPRTENIGKTNTAIKIDMYPYNWVTIEEAENICKEYSFDSRTSSLMYDIQYNLVCKYLEIKSELTKEDIAENSEKWGNYNNHEITLNRGKYSIGVDRRIMKDWLEYNINSEEGDYVIEDGIKKVGTVALLTTGASNQNKVLNIYDFTGNVFCYTLGNYTNGGNSRGLPYIIRGGFFGDNGSYMAASWNSWNDSINRGVETGFRNCVF